MNAILVSLGNLHTSMLGGYGGPWVETPEFDRFSGNAFVFDQCFIESPSPDATRHNWWTGQKQVHLSGSSIKAQCNSLIAHLRKNGVQTVLVTDAAPLANQSHASAGFEHVIEIQRGECDVTQDVLDAATQWLKRHSTKPFFLFADCYGAHDPIQLELEPPESESSEIEQHEQTDPLMLAVSWLDQLAGEFLEWLRVQPFWDYSIIGFTSDMGNVPTRFLADRSAQFDLSEWRTHIPLILRVPGIEPAGRANTLVQPMDLVPTVIEALGVPQLDGLDGASLLPLCRGETQSVRQFATALNPGVAHSVRTSDWLLIEPISSVASHDVSQVLLFAKPEDHWGRDNLAKRYPETVADLRRLLEGQ